jgi:1,2-phenylacetyl-CoA epoxidase PaaB subunit
MPDDKADYSTRFLIKYAETKGYEYLIVKTHVNITLIINEVKFTFWMVEIPDI